jgi:hypothetical protein
VRIKDTVEIGQRSIDLVGACVQWVKNPDELRVERIAAGSTAAGKEVPRPECCAALRQWLPTTRHFISKEEREDMEEFIRTACG